MEFRGHVERPEAFAWCEIIERMRRNPRRLLHWNICLIVDSDLELLEKINSRDEPVWRDYYLPPNFSLVYASADVGVSTDPLNKMMSYCDKDATRLFELAVRADPNEEVLRELSVVGGPSVRFWNAID